MVTCQGGRSTVESVSQQVKVLVNRWKCQSTVKSFSQQVKVYHTTASQVGCHLSRWPVNRWKCQSTGESVPYHSITGGLSLVQVASQQVKVSVNRWKYTIPQHHRWVVTCPGGQSTGESVSQKVYHTTASHEGCHFSRWPVNRWKCQSVVERVNQQLKVYYVRRVVTCLGGSQQLNVNHMT